MFSNPCLQVEPSGILDQTRRSLDFGFFVDIALFFLSHVSNSVIACFATQFRDNLIKWNEGEVF